MIATHKKPATPVNKKLANAAFRSAENWDTIDWDYHRTVVKKLQLRITKATQLGKYRKVKTLQWLLTHSFSAKLLAVRKVMQNKGSKTPGVDGIVITKPEDKLALAKNIKRRDYQPSPLRRIYIPKAGNKKMLRPLGIPMLSSYYLCLQCLLGMHLTGLISIK